MPSPIQVKSSLPWQEPSPTSILRPLPVQETLSPNNFQGAAVELDSSADGASPRSEEELKLKRKLRRLRMMEHERTGEGPYEVNSVIVTEGRYGVVQCFALSEDEELIAGIELVSLAFQLFKRWYGILIFYPYTCTVN